LELGKSNTGRNRAGRIILFTKSNRKHNLLYRIIDYKYSNFGVPCIVHRIEYDPNRTSFICLNIYINGVISYSIQTQNVKASSLINSYFQSVIAFNISSGDTFFLRYIPEGSSINNIEKHPFSGSLYSRSAGTSSTLIRKYESLNRCLVKLGSGYYKVLNMNCKATIGSVSNR
jgi:large subunit ribosomal protein L2